MGTTAEIQRILLIRLGGFGDVVFTLPAVHLVRARFPQARLAFLVYKELAPLLAGFPGVDEVLTLDRSRYRRLNPVAIAAETAGLLKGLAWNRFQLVVDFQGRGETGWLAWLSRAPQRWGLVYRPSRRWAYTRGVSRNAQFHPVDYCLELLRQAGGLVPDSICNEFVLPENALQEGRRFFCQCQLDPARPTLFLQPFTSTERKNWPLEHYLNTAQNWRQRGLQVLFGGGPGERGALEPVRRAGFPVSAGAPVLLSAALVKLSTVVLGGDTGLLHLGAALGTRVIMLIESLNPGACYPFGQRDWVVLPPKGSPVAAIAPQVVEEVCARALAADRAY